VIFLKGPYGNKKALNNAMKRVRDTAVKCYLSGGMTLQDLDKIASIIDKNLKKRDMKL